MPIYYLNKKEKDEVEDSWLFLSAAFKTTSYYCAA